MAKDIYDEFIESLTEEEKNYVITSRKEFDKCYNALKKNKFPCSIENLRRALTDPFKKTDYIHEQYYGTGFVR